MTQSIQTKRHVMVIVQTSKNRNYHNDISKAEFIGCTWAIGQQNLFLVLRYQHDFILCLHISSFTHNLQDAHGQLGNKYHELLTARGQTKLLRKLFRFGGFFFLLLFIMRIFSFSFYSTCELNVFPPTYPSRFSPASLTLFPWPLLEAPMLLTLRSAAIRDDLAMFAGSSHLV